VRSLTSTAAGIPAVGPDPGVQVAGWGAAARTRGGWCRGRPLSRSVRAS